jgi:hypothetical protein
MLDLKACTMYDSRLRHIGMKRCANAAQPLLERVTAIATVADDGRVG